jgi:hypothetical protein
MSFFSFLFCSRYKACRRFSRAIEHAFQSLFDPASQVRRRFPPLQTRHLKLRTCPLSFRTQLTRRACGIAGRNTCKHLMTNRERQRRSLWSTAPSRETAAGDSCNWGADGDEILEAFGTASMDIQSRRMNFPQLFRARFFPFFLEELALPISLLCPFKCYQAHNSRIEPPLAAAISDDRTCWTLEPERRQGGWWRPTTPN